MQTHLADSYLDKFRKGNKMKTTREDEKKKKPKSTAYLLKESHLT